MADRAAGVVATSRQKLRSAGQTPGSVNVVSVIEPGSGAVVYCKELESRGFPEPIVRFDLIAEVAGARARVASAFVDGRTFDAQSPLVIAVSGFPATAWHLEASAASPLIQFGAALAVSAGGGGGGKPSIFVPDIVAAAPADAPVGLLIARSGPQRYQYRAGTADTAIGIPAGSHLHTVSARGGLLAGTIEIGTAAPMIPVLPGTAFTEAWDTDDANSQARGAMTVTFTSVAAWFVSWFEGT